MNNIRSPCQGFKTSVHIIRKRIDATIPARIFIETVPLATFVLVAFFGAGLSILGRIRMPVIKRMSTSTSLIPVNRLSLCFAVGV